MGKFVVLGNIVGWGRGLYENRVLRVTFLTKGEQVTGEWGRLHDYERLHLYSKSKFMWAIDPSNAKLNPICHMLALLGAHHILHVSRISVKAK